MALDHHRRAGAFLIALAATIAFAAPASANHLTTYPLNANQFILSAEGWTDAVHDCTLIVLPNAVCTTNNEHSQSVGNPPGSLHSWYTTVANVAGLGTGTATWRSPSFTIDPELVDTVDGHSAVPGRFIAEKLFEARGALLDVGGEAATTVYLVDEATPANPNVIASDENGDFPAPTDQDPWQTADEEVPATELIPGHTYHLDIETVFSSTLQAALGELHAWYDNVGLILPSDAPPELTTEDATNIGDTGVTFNGLVDPRGSDTKVWYRYRPAGSDGAFTETPKGTVSGNTFLASFPQDVENLTPCTEYEYRIVGYNEDNDPAGPIDEGDQTVDDLSMGELKTVTTDCPPEQGPTGPTGPQGPQGETGGQGPAGPVGPAGVTGETGQTGAQGVAGSQGTAGPQGPAGPAGARGPAGVSGDVLSERVRSGSERALMNIRTGDIRLGASGRRAGIIRLRVFCSERVGRLCAGTVKIRTRNKIQPATRPPKRALRRVTLVTEEYQLRQGRVGYVIMEVRPETIDLMKRVKSVAVVIEMQVTDNEGNRQTVFRNARMRISRTA